MALAQTMAPAEQIELVERKFGKSPKGSFASYQLFFTESNFKVICDVDSVQRNLSNTKNDFTSKISITGHR